MTDITVKVVPLDTAPVENVLTFMHQMAKPEVAIANGLLLNHARVMGVPHIIEHEKFVERVVALTKLAYERYAAEGWLVEVPLPKLGSPAPLAFGMGSVPPRSAQS